ncbi:MAG TPA: hypothetical protein V6D14_25040 [Coleofasciculaceae cyanobacterium]|jgi:hypothetical protein
MRKLLPATIVSFTLLIGAASVHAGLFYTGLLTPSQTPDQQGWKYLRTRTSTAPSATATRRGTVLDSGNIKNYAGYFFQTPFKLDRNAGYNVSFSVEIKSESHSKDDRAGFSIIAVSDQLTGETQPFALELGFWTNRIWAYNANATRGEGVSINTQAGMQSYILYIKGNQYQLFTTGSTNPILKGSLRQYTGYTAPAGFPNPYKTPNLLFMGDDTTSATAQVTIARLYATPIVPRP